MASIKCQSCGRTYNYRSSELCPKCGAYNRPPHQMRVGFDENGGVELQSDREFRENIAESATVEDSVRKVGETLLSSQTLDSLGRELNKWGSRVEKWWTENSEKSATHAKVAKDSPLRDRRQAKRGGKSALAVVIAISIFASLIGSITESCSSNLVSVRPEPDYSIPVEEVAPSAETWQDEEWWTDEEKWNILSAYGVNEFYTNGSAVYWQGQTIEIGGWEITGESAQSFMVVSLKGDDLTEEQMLTRCYLLWVEPNGDEMSFNPSNYNDGALIFEYIPITVSDNTLLWLIMEQYSAAGEYWNTIAVELTEDDADASQNAAVEVWSEEEQKELLSFHDVTEEYSMGSGFIWQDTRVGIYGWGKDDNSMDVSIEGEMLSGEELLDTCYLLWYDIVDGEEHMYQPDSYENGALVFKNIRSEILDTTYIWLIMQEGYILNTESNTMENIGTIAVRLN